MYSITTTSHATAVQSLSLGYDLAGDLTSRHDSVAATNESFDYDDLEQLAAATSSGQALNYDAACRLTLKGKDRDFTYRDCDKPHPYHAPCSYIDGSGRRLDYSYDENGNRVKGPT